MCVLTYVVFQQLVSFDQNRIIFTVIVYNAPQLC